MTNIVPLFSSYGIASSGTDPRLSHHVAVKAALHETAIRQTAAEAQAELIVGRILEQLAVGPPISSDLRQILSLAATDEVLNSSSSPMDLLSTSMRQRTEEYRTRFNAQLAGWTDTTLQPVRSPTEDVMIAAAMAKGILRPRLVERIEVLRSKSAGLHAAAATAEASLRQRTAGIARTGTGQAPKKTAFVQTRKGFFIVVALLSIAVAAIVMPLAQLPFLPVPALIVIFGVAFGALYKITPAAGAGDRNPPYRVLQPQFIAYANQTSEAEMDQLQLLLTDSLLQQLNNSRCFDQLPEALQAVQSVLSQWEQAIPMHPWTGNSATQGMLTGRDITQRLWDARKDAWTSNGFAVALNKTATTVSFEALLMSEAPANAAACICQAAISAMKPITLTETTSALLQSVSGGQEKFLGELRGQVTVLKSLMPILSHKLALSDAACPTLLHIVLPASLANSLEPVLMQAFAAQPPQFYTSSDDTIAVIIESFNRANSERSNHTASEHALTAYARLAEEEQWSCFGPLLVQ